MANVEVLKALGLSIIFDLNSLYSLLPEKCIYYTNECFRALFSLVKLKYDDFDEDLETTITVEGNHTIGSLLESIESTFECFQCIFGVDCIQEDDTGTAKLVMDYFHRALLVTINHTKSGTIATERVDEVTPERVTTEDAEPTQIDEQIATAIVISTDEEVTPKRTLRKHETVKYFCSTQQLYGKQLDSSSSELSVPSSSPKRRMKSNKKKPVKRADKAKYRDYSSNETCDESYQNKESSPSSGGSLSSGLSSSSSGLSSSSAVSSPPSKRHKKTNKKKPVKRAV